MVGAGFLWFLGLICGLDSRWCVDVGCLFERWCCMCITGCYICCLPLGLFVCRLSGSVVPFDNCFFPAFWALFVLGNLSFVGVL